MMISKSRVSPVVLSLAMLLAGSGALKAADCNGNGIDDASDLLPRDFGFPAAPSYAVGGHPQSLVAADLNGDGSQDIATASAACPSLWCEPSTPSYAFVLLNRGDGTFEAAVSYPTGDGSWLLIAADLNGDEALDLATANASSYDVSVLMNQTTPPFSLDLNRNGFPDECEPAFHRGDPNDDGGMDLSDAVSVLGFLFLGGEAPGCLESADTNNDGAIDISDPISVLDYLFLGGPAPAEPGSPASACGLDPDPPGSPGNLGCQAYEHCS